MKKHSKIIAHSLPLLLLLTSSLVGCSGGNSSGPSSSSTSQTSSSKSEDHNHNFVIQHDEDEHWEECACGETKNRTAHSFEIIETIPACCDKGTQTVYKCKGCDYQYIDVSDDVIPHTFVASVKKEATCQEDGVMLYTCSKCAEHYEVSFMNADAHKWDEGTLFGGVTTHKCLNEGCHAEFSVVDAKEETTTELDIDVFANVGSVALKEATISLDDDAIAGLENNVTIGAEKVDSAAAQALVKEEDKELLKDAPVFDFTMKDGENDVHEFSGSVSISIPYTLKEGEDPEKIAIAYINEATGALEHFEAKYSNGQITFNTNHFSYYAVVKMDKEKACALFGHNLITTKTVDSTCAQHGKVVKMCTRCGENFVSELPLVDHHFVYHSTVPSTTTEHGYIEYHCDVCEEVTRSELPLVPEEKQDFLMSLLTSIANGNIHFDETVSMSMEDITQKESMMIDLLFSDKDNMLMASRNTFGNRVEESYIIDNFSYSSTGKRSDTTLMIIRNIVSQLQAAPKSINNFVTIFEKLLENNFFKKTIENQQAIIELDFDKIEEFVNSLTEDKLDKEFDRLFGEGSFESVYNFLRDFYTKTIEESLEYLSSKGFDVKEILAFANAVSMGSIPKFDDIFNEEMLKATGSQLLAGLLGEPFDKFDTIDQYIQTFKEMTVLELLQNFDALPEEITPTEFKGTIKEYISFAKENVEFSLRATSEGQFISLVLNMQNIEEVASSSYDEMDVSLNANTNVNEEEVRASFNTLKTKVDAVEDAFDLTKHDYIKEYLDATYGVSFERYSEEGRKEIYYRSEEMTNFPLATCYGDHDYDDRIAEKARVVIAIESYQLENPYRVIEDQHGITSFKDGELYGREITCHARLDYVTPDFVLEDTIPLINQEVTFVYDYVSNEMEVVNTRLLDGHLYKYVSISEREYNRHYGYTYSSGSDRHFYKGTCDICGDEVYRSTYDDYGSSFFEGVLSYSSMNEEARGHLLRIEDGSIYALDLTNPFGYQYMDEYSGYGINLRYRKDETITNYTYTFGNMKIAYQYKSRGGHDCCKNEIVTVSIDDEKLFSFTNAIHVHGLHDVEEVLVSSEAHGCETVETYHYICVECGTVIDVYHHYIYNHDNIKVADVPGSSEVDNCQLVEPIEVYVCENCHNVSYQVCGHGYHSLSREYDEETGEVYYVCRECGERYDTDHLPIVQNVTNLADQFTVRGDINLADYYLLAYGSLNGYEYFNLQNYEVSLAYGSYNEDGELVFAEDKATLDLDEIGLYGRLQRFITIIVEGQELSCYILTTGTLIIPKEEVNQYIAENEEEGYTLFIVITARDGSGDSVAIEIHF